MIGDRRKFIFVHVPKVAGRSFKQALSKYALKYSFIDRPIHGLVSRVKGFPIRMNEAALYHGHTTVKQYLNVMGHETFSNYFSFAIVRNPFDWHVSLYSYMQQTTKHPQHKFIKELNFNEYLDWRFEEEPIFQSDILSNAQGKIILNHIGKIEQLEKTKSLLESKLNMKLNIPRLNKSERSPFRKYYSNKYKKQFIKVFERDFINFHYNTEVDIEW